MSLSRGASRPLCRSCCELLGNKCTNVRSLLLDSHPQVQWTLLLSSSSWVLSVIVTKYQLTKRKKRKILTSCDYLIFCFSWTTSLEKKETNILTTTKMIHQSQNGRALRDIYNTAEMQHYFRVRKAARSCSRRILHILHHYISKKET